MSYGQQHVSLDDAKQIDLVQYLSHLGYEPDKIRNADYWYHSPLRNEKTPSFKVARNLNRWYDHGMGKGGNLIDFAVLYHGCTVGAFLMQLNGSVPFSRLPAATLAPHAEDAGPKIKVLHETSLSSFALYRYLKLRRISYEQASRYCKEVSYSLYGKEYFGIGFKNDSGGYELRNSYFKGSSTPKDVTTFQNNAPEVVVLEGFFDFLSFVTIHSKQTAQPYDFVILNSVAFFEKARVFMEQHQAIHLYLDRDKTGQNYTRYALSLSPKYRDESHLYEHYKDLNDWTMHIGSAPKKRLRQKL